ncbi:hypothetical protein CQY20_12860 [Mycolicibacterium agri]|uniref:Membrane protein n=1 Tax=Mycolicibacterium agri TaxID=36811 RepID=A0A2A7N3D3_MYCAG|nr:DUF308 domain-containing protein [Mycolicibacterium agri]PEG38582.1 hypothetical protein CQY20_12860 [Mycolicibacterium agri]GFG53550.1 membrane protein [Mycolicibacterium agri]
MENKVTSTALNTPIATDTDNHWLHSYYLLRAAVAGVWVAAAFIIGTQVSAVAGVLLVLYPLWDAVGNLMDAQHNGGLRRNPTQTLNTVVSILTAGAVAITLAIGMNAVLGMFGVWATLAGLFQLATGVRRWKNYGAQWPMILSGAQSALVGILFLKQANAPEVPGVADIAPYAAFGALYFLIAAVWLAGSQARRRKSTS